MEEVISERLIYLRKHISERLETKLTTADVGEKAGLPKHRVYNLENGLNGTIISLVCLLQFYRSHNYNLDWIIAQDNSRLPLILPSGGELQEISQTISDMSQQLSETQNKLNGQLRHLGYITLGTAVKEDELEAVPETTGLLD